MYVTRSRRKPNSTIDQNKTSRKQGGKKWNNIIHTTFMYREITWTETGGRRRRLNIPSRLWGAGDNYIHRVDCWAPATTTYTESIEDSDVSASSSHTNSLFHRSQSTKNVSHLRLSGGRSIIPKPHSNSLFFIAHNAQKPSHTPRNTPGTI